MPGSPKISAVRSVRMFTPTVTLVKKAQRFTKSRDTIPKSELLSHNLPFFRSSKAKVKRIIPPIMKYLLEIISSI